MPVAVAVGRVPGEGGGRAAGPRPVAVQDALADGHPVVPRAVAPRAELERPVAHVEDRRRQTEQPASVLAIEPEVVREDIRRSGRRAAGAAADGTRDGSREQQRPRGEEGGHTPGGRGGRGSIARPESSRPRSPVPAHIQPRPSAISSTPNTKNASEATTLIARSGSRVPSAAEHDRDRVGRDHARGRPEPRPPRLLGRGERDRREHRLVAQLGEEERGADRRARPAPVRAGARSSSSPSVSPRIVHAANTKNATPAATWMAAVGSATANTAPSAPTPRGRARSRR